MGLIAGMIGDVIEFIRELVDDIPIDQVKFDPTGDGEDDRIGEHYQPAGYDSQPIATDRVFAIRAPGRRVIIIGYIDTLNERKTRPGDSRFVARDSDGAVQAELHLTNDGEEPDWMGPVGALIARADKVETELDKLKTAHNDHKHGPGSYTTNVGSGGGGGPVSGDSDVPDKEYSPEPVGAEKGWVT